MKKLFAGIFALVLILALTGCGGDNNTVAGGSTGSSNNTIETGTNTQSTTEGTTENTADNTVDPTENQATIHTHAYSAKVTAPACTTDGYTTYTCSCGDSYVSDKTPSAGHNFGQWKTTKEPTGTSTGTAERTCSNCPEKETKTLGKLLEAHTHSYTSKITQAATCSAEGAETFTCSCGDAYTQSIAKTAHKYQDSVINPTCTNGGYTTHKCSACGDTYSDTKTAAIGHSYTKTTTNPTCTAGGYVTNVCKNCGHTFQSDKTNKLNHAYSHTVVKPTCTGNGYTAHTCSRCGNSYNDATTSATGHAYVLTSDTATCTASGKKTETCSSCGNQKVTNSAAKGHGSTRAETKEATTSAAGYTRVVCTICNGIISETAIPKLEAPHTCNMQRINCKDLKDGALGWCTANYKTFTECTILACSECGIADPTSVEHKYSSREATQMIVDMINQLRYNVYGTHAYDVKVATHMSCAEWAAQYIATVNYDHCTPFTENIGGGNCQGKIVNNLFNQWVNSPGHYAWLIDRDMEYFSLGVYVDDNGGMFGALVMWDKDELYLDNPNYHWSCR